MIVTIAAWLYIAQAVLMLASLLMGGASGFGESAMTLLFAGLFGAMGYGLLQRLAWARWLALGSSLLGWTLTPLFLIVFFGYLLFAGSGAILFGLLLGAGSLSIMGLVYLFLLLLVVANIVISYMLFWYLCSEEGCEAFGVPHGSTRAVLGSCGSWVGMFIVNMMVSSGGQSMYQLGAEDQPQVADAEQFESEEQAEARRTAAEYAERRERAEAMLQAQAELEAAQAQAPAEEESEDEAEAEAEVPVPVPETAPEQTPEQMPEQASAQPVATESSEEESGSSATRILKCIDASGGTIYTQGYCPPGSKSARMP